MELLDATIALAVTLAALATTVTVLMEVWVRVLGLKSLTQVTLFRRIFDEAVEADFGQAGKQKNFLNLVLANPLVAPKAGAKPEPFTKFSKFADFFWPARTERQGPIPDEDTWTAYLGPGDKGIYEWVSHEHVLRRILKLDGVMGEARETLVAKLKKFSRKYEELCAAASVEFKDNRRRWSVIGGVLLALAINADGVRIFNEYVKRPELAASVAAHAEQLEAAAQAANEKLEAAISGEGADEVEALKGTVDRLTTSVEDLQTSGVPIGWRYWPHCVLDGRFQAGGAEPGGQDEAGEDAKAQRDACEAASEQSSMAKLGAWLAILGTGLLIGLGAPFWFDVARRLAEVRSFFGGKGSGDSAYNGEDVSPTQKGQDKAKATEKLINRVVDETLAARNNDAGKQVTSEAPVG